MRKRNAAILVLLLAALAEGGEGPEIERGRDPFELARSQVRQRVWVLLDTSHSMNFGSKNDSRLDAALRAIRGTVDEFRSRSGEPLADWAFATFAYQASRGEDVQCSDPSFGAALPTGWEKLTLGVPNPGCQGVAIRTVPDDCDPEAGARALLGGLPRVTNSVVTPIGIGIQQLAAHISENRAADLAPGQQNVILLLTDGEDNCECKEFPWLDFHEGPAGIGSQDRLSLRIHAASPDPVSLPSPGVVDVMAHNAGLRARTAFRLLGGGDSESATGDIFVVGFGMSVPEMRERVNHIAWMASGLRRPALHALDGAALRDALRRTMDAVTLPRGRVALSAPALASIKELVAGSPSPRFPGSDPARSPTELVADPSRPADVRRALALREMYRDNVLISTAAELHRLRGHLWAKPTPAHATAGQRIWDAGEQLRDRDPDDRMLLFNRPGGRELIPFRVGKVTATDLGVASGYLEEMDGAGARSASDAAEIVVRITRGEELAIHPATGLIYDPDGRLHFVGGVGTWKLRETLATPTPVGSPPSPPERVARRRQAYRSFFADHANRRTVLYLPTSGGMLHAFAADTGHEILAYIPDDVLGPAPGEVHPGRTLLRDLALQAARPEPGFEVSRVSRFTLAGSAVVRDIWLDGANRWATVLAFGRDYGGRFVTALDVSGVGGVWKGDLKPPAVRPGGPGIPKLLFNVGNRTSRDSFSGFGHTPLPVLAEVPDRDASSRSVVFQAAGAGAPGNDSGAWLFALSPEDGRIERRFRVSGRSGAVVRAAATPAPPAVWRPAFAGKGGGDLVTRVFLADVQGQVHRLDTRDPAGWRWGEAFQLGADQPVLTPPVALALPGRTEPHLLVVTGGDRRVPNGVSRLVLLREAGTRMEEVWSRELEPGETPQGTPAVLSDGVAVDVILATQLAVESSIGCSGTRSAIRSRLRGFNGITGQPAAGIVASESAILEMGSGPARGVTLSRSGNMAISVTGAAGEVVDMVFGDFRFRVRDGALENVTLFVEGFRRSPF